MMRLIDTEMLPWENQNMDEFGDWSLKVYEIEEMPTIDPVHAAGACYCKECKHFGREVVEGSGKHSCNDYRLPNCKPDDFCSYGKKA